MTLNLSIYSYNHRPKYALTTHYLTETNQLNELKYNAHTIIKSNAFNLLIDTTLNSIKNSLNQSLATLKFEERNAVYANDLDDIHEIKRKAELVKQHFEKDIEHISSLTPNDLLNQIDKGIPLQDDLHHHIISTFGKSIDPLFNLNQESLHLRESTSKTLKSIFEDILQTSFDNNTNDVPYYISNDQMIMCYYRLRDAIHNLQQNTDVSNQQITSDIADAMFLKEVVDYLKQKNKDYLLVVE